MEHDHELISRKEHRIAVEKRDKVIASQQAAMLQTSTRLLALERQNRTLRADIAQLWTQRRRAW